MKNLLFHLPNQLTLARIVLSFVFMGVFFSGIPFAYTFSLILFLLAGLTDMLDGRIARSRGLENDFGKLMDPLADKILISTAFISFVQLRETEIAAWMVVLIIAREFLITGLRLFAMSKGQLIAAGIWGKHKAVSQIFAICLVLTFLSFKEIIQKFPGVVGHWDEKFSSFYYSVYHVAIGWTMAVVVGLTLLSGILYVYQNRSLFILTRSS